MTSRYTRRELMVVAAAREIRDHEVVFVGMRLPLLGFGLAKATHAPDAVGLFENGVIRDRPAEAFIYTMGDPPNIAGAIACLGLNDVMSLLQQGRVDVGFIGGRRSIRSAISTPPRPAAAVRWCAFQAAAAAGILPRWPGGLSSSWNTNH